VANDIATDERVTYRQQALAHGYRSLIALPLLVEDKPVAVFLIYAADSHMFDQEEMTLLGELADDVSFALAYIEKEERLNYLAYYDVLTGLPNRNLLNDRLSQAISHSRRYDSMTAVAFIDLDQFKFINDSLGHTTGDFLLKVVAERFAACLRDGDTVARLGGDEFVMVLPGQSSVEAINQVMQRIRAGIAEPVPSPKGALRTSCSIGIALFPQDGEDVEALLKHADAAMYRAKEMGRNTFQFFTREMNAKLNDRLEMEKRLRLAVQHGEIRLEYQPLVEQRTGVIVGVEALARWSSPEAGAVPPQVFIPLAEETDLILAVGEWVLREACVQNKAWQQAGLRPVPVSVNVSARQFRQVDLPGLAARVLAETGLDARWLNLEVTEGVILQNPASTAEVMGELHAMGVTLSIDDFGTGYSSLANLKRFPVSRLKIDRSFVGDISGDSAIAQAVVSLGHSLGLRVVAEGVETAEQAAFLATRDCDEAQGYYYCAPVSAEEFARLLKEGLQRRQPN
jgi:diguanylate cyclase (GGDEF)-like protein